MTAKLSGNRHLSPDRLSEWALGKRDFATTAHVSSCALCRAKVEHFDQVLVRFRSALWQEAEATKASAKSPRPKASRPQTGALSLAFALLFVLLGMCWSAKMGFESRRVDDLDDAVLLAHVSQEVSRTVPAAMDPLATLVMSDDPSGDASRP